MMNRHNQLNRPNLESRRDWMGVVVGILLLVLLLVMSLGLPLDPDMGWHLRNGLDIIANLSLPTGDTYSWTMAGYPWVPHEWLTDVIMAGINSLAGLWGLVIAFMLLIAGTFYFAAGIYPTNRFSQAIIAIIALLVSWNIIGVRPQMITLLGVAVVLYLLFQFRNQPLHKTIYWLPAVFLLWANLHGGFPVAFFIIALFIVGEIIRRILLGKTKPRQIVGLMSAASIWKLITISGVSFLATFINPSGWKVYQELIQTFGDRSILNEIAEWMGVSLFHPGSYNLAIMALLVLLLLSINRWRVDITKLIIVVAMFWFCLTSWRHVPLFAIVALPLIAEQFDSLVGNDIKKIFQQWMAPVLLALMILVIGNNYFTIAVPALRSPAEYGETFNYPYGVVEYFKDHPKPRKMLNEYNWGGYLIWQLPEVKVFIDGRMAIWKWRDIEIFKEYKTLLGINRDLAFEGIERWEVDTILTSTTHLINAFLSQTSDEWTDVYRDSSFVIWER